VDRELRGYDLLMVSRHLSGCEDCAGEVRRITDMGDWLRGEAASRPVPVEALAGLADGVVSRVRAEEQQSWTALLGRALDDFHWAVVGAGSMAAAVASALAVCAMLQVGIPERGDSLAAMLNSLSSPVGSDENPLFMDFEERTGTNPHTLVQRHQQLPSLGQVDVVPTALSEFDGVGILADVNREGRITNIQALNGSRKDAKKLEDELRDLRLTPATSSEGPVATRVVWLVANTHVHGVTFP
jgi:hypothetical protein